MKIAAIEKNGGEYCYFSIYNRLIDTIKEEWKDIGFPSSIMVYRGYREGKLCFEIEAGSGITLIYDSL